MLALETGFHLRGAYSAEAKAFALMSEEGIAKGVRRIVAVTAAEAAAAIAEGERLAGELEAVAKLEGAEQEKEVSSLKQVLACGWPCKLQHQPTLTRSLSA